MADGTKTAKPRKAVKLREKAEANPAVLVAGGIALGAVIGAIVPRLAKEREALAPIGKRLAETASDAIKAARDAGKAEIDALLPQKDQARDRVGQLVTNVLEAAKGAAKKKG